MTILIASDIFGHTPALDRLVRGLGRSYPEQIGIIDPYGDGIYFEKEDEAYKYFTSRTNIPAYAGLIAGELETLTCPVTLLGFSIGASAIWYLSGQGPQLKVSTAIGFYGSQIRRYPDISPGFDIRLVFPESEPHFNVDRLMEDLSGRHPRVNCEKAMGRHGFMNEYSKNYDHRLSGKCLKDLSLSIS